MLSAEKIRDIAKRARHNIYDEQLRILNEEILESAKLGNNSFTIYSQSCSKEGFDYDFWFEGAKNDTVEWQKIYTLIQGLGYTITYSIRKFDDMAITVFW